MTWYSVIDTDLIHWSMESSFEQVVHDLTVTVLK
jgi:hypothetical protein